MRAVLEGVAQRGADLVEAAEADTGLSIEALRVDGGMSANPTFTQALADATGRPVEVSPVIEATTLGAAFLAGLATGVWDDVADADRLVVARTVHEPGAPLDREVWSRAVDRSRRRGTPSCLHSTCERNVEFPPMWSPTRRRALAGSPDRTRPRR